jgi:uncharacterized damage-inducible protein DinB
LQKRLCIIGKAFSIFDHMRELLRQLAAYHYWAHRRITDVILALPEEKQLAEVQSSYKNLHLTLLHLWDAESIWWNRMKLYERFALPSDNFKGTTRDVIDGLLSQAKLWETWTANAPEHLLDHVFQYNNSRKEQFKLPIYQMLMQVFNHGTYHRGQLITMMRQLGIDKLPGTDFFTWSRLKK